MTERRWWQFWAGRGKRPTLDPHRSDLVVVAAGFDDAEACSTVLDRATDLHRDAPVLLRHHLRVPTDQVESVCALAAQDGYERMPNTDPAQDAELEALVLARVQMLDALHCSQERSRMAGLAQRHRGTVLGWDALQPS